MTARTYLPMATFLSKRCKSYSRGHIKTKLPGWNFERQRSVSARMVDNVARFAQSGHWLDVGFGNGSLLFTAEEWGFTPVGLDLRRASVAAMQKIGIEAHCVDVTNFDGSEQFSVISMADVLSICLSHKRV